MQEVEDKDVFDAIVTFYLICDYHKGSDSISEALDYFASVAAYKIFPLSLNNEGAQVKTHQFIKYILAAFGVINETEEDYRDEKDDKKVDNKISNLITKYQDLFNQEKYGYCHKTSQLLHFNRHIRNAVAHKDKEFEPGLRQEVAVQFLYNYIIVVYMLKFVLRRDLNKKFQKYYNGHKKNYNIPVRIEEVSSPTTLQGEGEDPISIGTDGDYSLSPFTKYTFKGFDSTFDLNEYCYNATINPPSHKKYAPVINLPQEGLDAELKKQLETLQDTVNKKIGESQNLDDMRKAVSDGLEKAEGLFEVCNAIKTDIAELKDQQDDVKNDLKNILENCNKNNQSLDILNEKIDELCKNTSFKELVEGIGNLSEKINKVGEDIGTIKDTTTTILTNQEREERRNKRYRILALTGVIVVVLAGILYFFRVDVYRSLYDKYHWEYCCKVLYDNGDPNIAYEYAQVQEREKNFPRAAEWYRKAISRYKEIVAAKTTTEAFSLKDTSVTEAYFRLAWMYAEAKGGIFDKQQALKYVSKIKDTERGIGLYALLVEDIKEAEEQIVYLKNYEKDDFMLLAEAMWQLDGLGSNQCQTDSCYMEAINTLERLIAKEDSPVRGEALYMYGCALIYGYGPKDNVKYCLYKGMDKWEKAALEENHITSQVYLARKYVEMGFFDDSKRFYELALSNGTYMIIHELIASAKLADCPQEYLDSLNRIKHSLIPDSFIQSFENAISLQENGLYEQAISKSDNLLKKVTSNSKYFIKEDMFIKNLMILKLKANVDLNQIVSDTMLVNCPPEKRTAYVNYLMGIKYAKGYGVEKDQAKSDSLIQSAANDSIVNAIYTWGNLLYQRDHNTLAAIAELRKIEDKDVRAVELLADIFKYIDENTSDDYLKKITDDSRLYKVVNQYRKEILPFIYEPDHYSFENCEKHIHVLEGFLCRNGFSDKQLSTIIAGFLACLYQCMNVDDDIIQFYAEISANQILDGEGYQYLMYLSDILYSRGEFQKAEKYYELFSLNYFDRQYQDDDYEDPYLDQQVINTMKKRFPGMIERVSALLQNDITKRLKPGKVQPQKDIIKKLKLKPGQDMIYTIVIYEFPTYPF